MERVRNVTPRRSLAFALVAFALGGSLYALGARSGRHGEAREPRVEPPLSSLAGPSSGERHLPALRDDLAVLLVGGGAEPESAGVQLEQDIRHAGETFAGPALLLFGGGPSVISVREAAPEPAAADPLFGQLARLFDPRERGARYRPTVLEPEAPATGPLFREALGRILARPGAPLVVFVAAHGEQGETPAENAILLWGSTFVQPTDLAAVLADPATVRPSRLVVTSCYGGGFADVVFGPQGPEGEALTGDHCGVFATDWDHLASGCDTSPDRSSQEGYAIHFLGALRGTDRDERPLPHGELDLDHDGGIGLLDAHTRARIAGRSFDLPIATSDRFLRQWTASHALDVHDERPHPDPHEDAVIAALGAELSAEEPRIALAVRDRLRDELEEAEGAAAEAEAARDTAFYALRIELLERFPILDDPWHPDFRRTLETNRRAIETVLSRSTNARDYAEADERAGALADEADAARVALARAERLVAAFEHRAMAGALERRDPTTFERYETLRRCERYAPPVRPRR